MSLFDTHVPMPNPASALAASQFLTWFQENDASRYEDMFDPFVVTGLLHPVPSPGSNTSDSFSGEAYDNGGNYILQEATTVTYSGGDGTYWVIATGDDEAVNAGWTREIGTHIQWQVNGAQPALPQDAVFLMQVTVSGGVITAVTDLRNLSPVEDQIESILITLIQTDTDVIAALEAAIEDLILNDPDVAAFVTSLINTILAGLDFVAGANVGAGTGNVFRDSSGSLPETLNFKTLIGGTNVTVTDNANDITIDASDTDTTYTGANLGGEQEVFKQLSGTTFQFRTLEGIGAISITQNGDVLEFRSAEGIKVMAYSVQTLTTSPVGSFQSMHDHSWAAGVWQVGDIVIIETWGQVISGANTDDKDVRFNLDGNVIATSNIACHNSATCEFYMISHLMLVGNTLIETWSEIFTDIAAGDHDAARGQLSGVFTISTDTPDLVIAAQIPNASDTITIRTSRVSIIPNQFSLTASNNH